MYIADSNPSALEKKKNILEKFVIFGDVSRRAKVPEAHLSYYVI